MKKIIIIAINLLLLFSCTAIDYKYKWYTAAEVINSKDELQEGDILILSKGSTIGTMWGHSAVINKNKRIVDFPTYGVGYNEQSLATWSSIESKIAIFRLKGIDDDFKKELEIEFSKTENKMYGLTFNASIVHNLFT